MKSKKDSIQNFLLEEYNLTDANEILTYLIKRCNKEGYTKIGNLLDMPSSIESLITKWISDYHRVTTLKLLIYNSNSSYIPYKQEQDLLDKIGDLI